MYDTVIYTTFNDECVCVPARQTTHYIPILGNDHQPIEGSRYCEIFWDG